MNRETPNEEHPAEVMAYVSRLYDEGRRRFACRARDPEEFLDWQDGARPVFRQLLGLPRIAEMARGHTPEVRVEDDSEDMGSYVRQRGWIETEPDVRVRFWLLTPKADGPLPLAITPHGHENGDTYVGIWHNDRSRDQIENEDQDVAVQAAERGFVTVAPATRGMGANPSSYRIADIASRHGGTDCRCHNWQVVVTGRSMLGERVWDLMRVLDWTMELPTVDAGRVLMVGNSGGGMATLHTAASDERIQVAVPCCAYNNYVSPQGTLRHCPCNAVPGLLDFGEYWDVAGLVAPRFLLTVNGRKDVLHPVPEVDDAVSRLEAIYQSAGAGERYEHRYGDGGHRFYSALMWPWIEGAMGKVMAG